MKLTKKAIIKFLFKKRGKSITWLLLSMFSSVFVMICLYTFGAIPVLYVNTEPVYGPDITRLVNDYGLKGAFEKAIEFKLVQFEAKRRDIQITAEDRYFQYQKLVKEAERQGATVAQMLAESDENFKEFSQNVETTITIYKLLGEDLYITEAEVDDYFTNNRLLFEDVDDEKLREDVKDILFKEKISHEYNEFIKEAKARSDIDYFLLTE